eukprot:jgi/Botrbrau1/22016/Bobra.0024s0030.1
MRLLLMPCGSVVRRPAGPRLSRGGRSWPRRVTVRKPAVHCPPAAEPLGDLVQGVDAGCLPGVCRTGAVRNGSGGRSESEWVLPRYWEGGREYVSAARVVLLGHGADEQCGGYGRHRTKFRSQGWEGLGEELALDMSRLWLRNMGRDDRLVADTGREARHPYLDEHLVCSLTGMPLAALADLRLPPGQGDKRVLRAALMDLGLHHAAVRVKRAIQFGTRLSKQMNVQEFGSNRAANMNHAGTKKLWKSPQKLPRPSLLSWLTKCINGRQHKPAGS